VSSAIRFARQAKETGHVEIAPRKPRQSRLDAFHDVILAWIAVQPDLTLAEMSARFADEHGMRVVSVRSLPPNAGYFVTLMST